MSDLNKLVEQVDTREKFIAFVDALATDSARQKGEWAHERIPDYLDAIAAWASASTRSAGTGEPSVPEHPTWKAFAEILLAGKYYE